jgi:antitoxin YefM
MLKDTKSLSLSEARGALTSLPEKLDRENDAVAITRRGKPVLAVMSWDLYESIIETIEILGDEKALAALRRGIAEIVAGKGVSWEKAKRSILG